MKTNLYVIVDYLTSRISEPFTCSKDELAVRLFVMSSLAEDLDISDSKLFCIGSYEFADDFNPEEDDLNDLVQLLPHSPRYVNISEQFMDSLIKDFYHNHPLHEQLRLAEEKCRNLESKLARINILEGAKNE